MNISRILVGALVLGVLPVSAQPAVFVTEGASPSYRLVSPEEAEKMTLTEKPMKFQLRDATLAEALGELETQSGITLDTSFGGNPATLAKTLSLDLETRSFNEAFAAILEEADVKARLQKFPGRSSWNVLFGQAQEQDDLSPQSGVGPFQVSVLNLDSTLSKSVTPTQTKAAKRTQTNQLNINFGFKSNPQLPLSQSPTLRITRATDENGRSLRAEDAAVLPNGVRQIMRTGFANYVTMDGSMQPFAVALGAIPEKSEKLAVLEGTATYVLIAKREKWEVEDVLNAKGASHDFQIGAQKVTLSIKDIKKAGDGVMLDLRASPNNMVGGTPLVSAQQLISALKLADSKGQLTASSINSTGGGNELSLQITYSQLRPPFVIQNGQMVPAPLPDAPALADQLKLTLNLPTEFVRTEVPFSFSDLPLP